MTLDQFLELLESKVEIKWGFNPRNFNEPKACIRSCDDVYACPISGVLGKGCGRAFQCAETLGLDFTDRRAIISAADKATDKPSYSPVLRQRLLKACRLEEGN